MLMKEKILKVKPHSSETHTQAGNTLYHSVSKTFFVHPDYLESRCRDADSCLSFLGNLKQITYYKSLIYLL